MEIAASAALVKAGALTTGIRSAEELAAVVSRIKKDIEPYSADLRDLKIDYFSRLALMTVYVKAPISISRALHKIRIHVDGDLRLKEIRTALYKKVPTSGIQTGGEFLMRASDLPQDSEDFLFVFEGQLSDDALRNLVDVRSSADPMVDGGHDVYWLLSTLNHPELLSQIYDAVEIDKVNVAVHVALQRHFFTSLPPAVHRMLQARNQLLRGAQTGDRSQTRKAEFTIRRSSRRNAFSETDLMSAIGELLAQSTLREYVIATDTYRVESVDADERRTSLIPEKFKVQAGTTLSYGTRIARGSLRFSRDDYKARVASVVGGLTAEAKEQFKSSARKIDRSE